MRRELIERELTKEGPRRGAGPEGAARKGRRSVTVNLREAPIAWLYARGHIPARLFEAGEKLHRDYERANLAPSITMRWDPVRAKSSGDGALTPSERQVAAKRRFDGAMAAAGKGLEDVLWRVVCAGEALPAAEKTLGWPARSGKLVLKLALERVADFYRVE